MGIEWALYAIHEHPEDEVRTKQLQICTEKLSNMLLVFAFPAVNKLDVCLEVTKSSKIAPHRAVHCGTAFPFKQEIKPPSLPLKHPC